MPAPPTSPPRLLTLPRLWALAALTLIFVAVNLVQVTPNDFWWHVRAGQWILEHREIPTVDLFSFTQAGQPWAYQSWLMEVVMHLALRAGDLPLVIFLHALAITAAYGALLWVNRQAAGGSLRWAALATLAAAFASPNWNVRPQTLSVLLFGITLLLLERHAARNTAAQRTGLTGDPALWLLPPLFLLWANGHGGFIFGLLLVGTYTLAALWDRWRHQSPFPTQLLAVAVASGLASLVTPLGLGMVDYVLGFMRSPVTRLYNVEFMPPTIRTLDGQLFFAFVLIWLVLLLASRYRLRARQALPLLAFGILALMSRRNGIWFCYVAAPVMAASMAALATRHRPPRAPSQGRPLFNGLLLALLALLALLSLPWFRSYLPLPAERRTLETANTPVAAVATLCRQAEARRVFHEQGYGSYMIWACPEKPVFIDTRLELYPTQQWLDYQAIVDARYDWQQLLDKYQIDTLLLDRQAQEQLVTAVQGSTAWRPIHEDQQAVIFARTEPG